MSDSMERDVSEEIRLLEEVIASDRILHPLDRDDLRNVVHLMRKGELQEAAKAADSLDTLVRDAIPQKVWDLLFEQKQGFSW
jgi:hypothetical protein